MQQSCTKCDQNCSKFSLETTTRYKKKMDYLTSIYKAITGSAAAEEASARSAAEAKALAERQEREESERLVRARDEYISRRTAEEIEYFHELADDIEAGGDARELRLGDGFTYQQHCISSREHLFRVSVENKFSLERSREHIRAQTAAHRKAYSDLGGDERLSQLSSELDHMIMKISRAEIRYNSYVHKARALRSQEGSISELYKDGQSIYKFFVEGDSRMAESRLSITEKRDRDIAIAERKAAELRSNIRTAKKKSRALRNEIARLQHTKHQLLGLQGDLVSASRRVTENDEEIKRSVEELNTLLVECVETVAKSNHDLDSRVVGSKSTGQRQEEVSPISPSDEDRLFLENLETFKRRYEQRLRIKASQTIDRVLSGSRASDTASIDATASLEDRAREGVSRDSPISAADVADWDDDRAVARELDLDSRVERVRRSKSMDSTDSWHTAMDPDERRELTGFTSGAAAGGGADAAEELSRLKTAKDKAPRGSRRPRRKI